MKRRFALCLGAFLALILFEIANVWFIMPLPGSQRMRSIDIAYAIYQWRWPVRVILGVLAVAGASGIAGWTTPRRLAALAAALTTAGVAYATNFRMAADQIFKPPHSLAMVPAAQNTVPGDRLVVGVQRRGEARAYPLMYIGYHHQVRDSVGGEAVLVSYCTVCRTGRVFSPLVDGRAEEFRLVGMDHWNAMFEDATTGSWWRQANGEAVTGPRRGKSLEELPSTQVTLEQWLAMHPRSLIMQADSAFLDEYAKDYSFENGTSRKALTGTDTASWGEKSWVVGIVADSAAVAFDWNRLKRERVINGMVGRTPVVLALANDGKSFFAFHRSDAAEAFELRGDSLRSARGTFAVTGRGTTDSLAPITASQEFWHSWRTFHPRTTRQ